MCQDCQNQFYDNPKATVGILLIYSGKVCLAKRNHNPGKGLWAIPGGFVEREENSEQALRREVKEELNLDIEISNLDKYLGSYNLPYTFQEQLYNTLFTIFIYEINKVELQTIKINEENSDLKFFDTTEVQELENSNQLFQNNFKIIQDFRSKCK
jgi:ADP-ribose pyrophosphatase YjhB (NUDIX family)